MYEKGYTHGGPFHLDEMAAISILQTINPNFTYERQPFRGAEIPDEYKQDNAIIFDVGGGEFDHHDKSAQREHENGVLYAACGKVYEAVRDEFQKATGLSDRGMKSMDYFVECVDAADNGQFLENNPEMGQNDLATTVKSFFDPKHPENFEKACALVQNTIDTMVFKELAIDKGLKLTEYDADKTIENFLENLSTTDEHFKNYIEHPTTKDEVYIETLTANLHNFNPKNSIMKDMLKYKSPEECQKILNEITYTGGLTAAEKNAKDYQRIYDYDVKDVVKGTAILDEHLTMQEPHIKEVLNEKGIHFIEYPNFNGTQYNLQAVDTNEIGFPQEWAGYTGANSDINVPEEVQFVHVGRFMGTLKAPDPTLSDTQKREYLVNTTNKIVGQIYDLQNYKIAEPTLENTEETNEPYPGFVFEPNETGYTLVDCDKSIENIKVPDMYNGKPVTALGNGVFEQCINLKGIELSKNLQEIRDRAFKDCHRLEAITIPDNVKTISEEAFYGCWNLQSINLNNNLEVIKDKAFGNCHAFETITIPNSVKTIGSYAFKSCQGVKEIICSDNIKTIEEATFKGCKELQSITVGENLESINQAAFLDCRSLQSINIPDTIKSIGEKAFENCKSLNNINLGKNLEMIGDDAFSDCTSFTSIAIPDSVKTVGYSAFSHCVNLESINFGKSLTNLRSFTCFDCNSLATVSLSDNLKTIENDAFCCCRNLKSITIPNNVQSIGMSAFDRCENLETVLLGQNLETIEMKAFSKCSSLKSISIPDNVRCIEKKAFSKCENLESVSLGHNLEEMQDQAFRKCRALKSIVIPDNLKTINPNTFVGCNNLKSVTMGKNVETIKHNAFSCCLNLESITLNDNLKTIQNNAFEYCHKLSSMRLPDSITAINPFAFYHAENFKDIIVSSELNDYMNEHSKYFKGISKAVHRTIEMPTISLTSDELSIFNECPDIEFEEPQSVVVDFARPNIDQYNLDVIREDDTPEIKSNTDSIEKDCVTI